MKYLGQVLQIRWVNTETNLAQVHQRLLTCNYDLFQCLEWEEEKDSDKQADTDIHRAWILSVESIQQLEQLARVRNWFAYLVV